MTAPGSTRLPVRLAIGISTLVALAGAFTYLFNDRLQEHVLPPLFRQLLIAQMVLRSLPQLPLWILVTAAAALALSVTLLELLRSCPSGKRDHSLTHRGRVQELARRIELAQSGTLFRWTLRRDLRDLAAELTALRDRMLLTRARASLRQGQWLAPAQIQAMLHPRAESLDVPAVLRYLEAYANGAEPHADAHN